MFVEMGITARFEPAVGCLTGRSAGDDEDLRIGRKGRMERGEKDWTARMMVDDGKAVFSVTISEEGLRIASDVKRGVASKKSETKFVMQGEREG